MANAFVDVTAFDKRASGAEATPCKVAMPARCRNMYVYLPRLHHAMLQTSHHQRPLSCNARARWTLEGDDLRGESRSLHTTPRKCQRRINNTQCALRFSNIVSTNVLQHFTCNMVSYSILHWTTRCHTERTHAALDCVTVECFSLLLRCSCDTLWPCSLLNHAALGCAMYQMELLNLVSCSRNVMPLYLFFCVF